MRVLLALSHAIEEHDQLQLLHSLGYEVASIGGYIDPAHPHDPKRPALPEVPCFPELKEAVDGAGGPGLDNLGLAQQRIPDKVLEWLGDDGAIVYHHYLERLYGQYDRIEDWLRGASGRRVIWRTVGQSVADNELRAQEFRPRGLEIVRYSPQERNIPGYAGEDALIRFWKDPDEWSLWTGEWPLVANITQHLQAREPFTNYGFWRAAVEETGLPSMPAGPGSETLGGPGELGFEEMKALLRKARCYLYCGTQPASYTLGLLEALMTGVPVVSIGASWMQVFPYGPDLFEGHLLAPLAHDHPSDATKTLHRLLHDDPAYAREISIAQRARALELFSRDVVAEQWKAFLG